MLRTLGMIWVVTGDNDHIYMYMYMYIHVAIEFYTNLPTCICRLQFRYS